MIIFVNRWQRKWILSFILILIGFHVLRHVLHHHAIDDIARFVRLFTCSVSLSFLIKIDLSREVLFWVDLRCYHSPEAREWKRGLSTDDKEKYCHHFHLHHTPSWHYFYEYFITLCLSSPFFLSLLGINIFITMANWKTFLTIHYANYETETRCEKIRHSLARCLYISLLPYSVDATFIFSYSWDDNKMMLKHNERYPELSISSIPSSSTSSSRDLFIRRIFSSFHLTRTQKSLQLASMSVNSSQCDDISWNPASHFTTSLEHP